MKYFFLSDGWIYERVWEFGGLWAETTWGRKPHVKRLNCGLMEQGEMLWLYEVEDAVLMVEVKPSSIASETISNIGQVVLKRLITAEQVIEVLVKSETIFNQGMLSSANPTFSPSIPENPERQGLDL